MTDSRGLPASHPRYHRVSRSESSPQPWAGFAGYGSPETSRTPAKILAHMGDLMDWALAMSDGRREWHDSAPLAVGKRMRALLRRLEKVRRLSGVGKAAAGFRRKLFQGPIADALTHIGQIAMLRRMAGVPVKGENYYRSRNHGRTRRRGSGGAAQGIWALEVGARGGIY
jgi:hypothetical protein